MRFQIYRTRTKQYRWRLRAANGEIIAHGESYKRKADCLNAMRLMQAVNADTEIQDLSVTQ